MEHFPNDLTLEEGKLRIVWSDGKEQSISVRSLRDRCPCANCREKRMSEDKPVNPLSIISTEEAAPVEIVGMRPVGSYGYSIAFNDGHSTGIFSLELLRQWDSS